MGRVPTDCKTSQEWGVWLVDQHLPGGRKGPLLPAAQPRRPAARDALPLGELFGCFCWLGCTLGHAPRRRKEPGHLGRCGLDWAGKGELTSYAPVINPRLRSRSVSCRLLGKLVLLLLCDSRGQTLGPGPALAAGDGRHTISV